MQVRFGAQSGTAPVLLGLGKLLAGLLFGSSLLALLQAFPQSLLGAMLIFSGASELSAAECILMHLDAGAFAPVCLLALQQMGCWQLRGAAYGAD